MSDDNEFEMLSSVWKDRKSHPLKVAKALSVIIDREKLSPHKIALKFGARTAEMAAFIDLSCLSPKAQKYFGKYRIPVTLAIDIVNEEEDVQEQVLHTLCENLSPPNQIIDQFETILYQLRSKKYYWREALTGGQLMHISSKAKNYNVLSKKQRKALYDIGEKLKWGYTLTKKQRRYLNDILEKCRDAGILTRSCFNNPCQICNEIAALIERS